MADVQSDLDQEVGLKTVMDVWLRREVWLTWDFIYNLFDCQTDHVSSPIRLLCDNVAVFPDLCN